MESSESHRLNLQPGQEGDPLHRSVLVLVNVTGFGSDMA